MKIPDEFAETFGGVFGELANGGERTEWAPERRGQTREPLPEHTRIAIMRRDRFTCQWCNTRNTLFEIDHIVPWSAGGSDHSVNLRTLCTGCNQDRSNFRTDGFAARPLPVADSCQRCRFNADSNDLAIPAFCLRCDMASTSCVVEPIPTKGVPS